MSSLIGEAFVRIRPDLTGFRAETQAAVRSSLISAPKIRVAPDTSQFAADATAGVRTALSSLSSGTSTGGLKIRPDTSTLAAEAAVGVEAAVQKIPSRSRTIKFLPDFSGFTSQATRSTALLAQGAGLGGFSGAIARGGTAAGILAVGAAAVTVAKQAATLEQSLNVLQATSGATDQQMKAISQTARQLGADIHLPAVSASDAATAMLELSKAGLSVQDAMKGARGTLELATAGQLAVGDAAKIIGTTLNTFALQGAQAAHVADLLAGAANHSAGEVSDFALALAQTGTVAKQFGLSADQTVGALGLLAKNGILASDAGTSFKVLLSQLIPTSTQAAKVMDALGVAWHDQAGQILPLNEILDQYRTQLAKLPPALQAQAKAQIVGTDGIRAFNILLNEGTGAIDKAAAAYGRRNTAQKLADAQTKGLAGSVQGLLSNLQTLATDLGTPLLGPLTKFTHELTVVVADADKAAISLGKLGKIKLPDLITPKQGTTVGDVAKQFLKWKEITFAPLVFGIAEVDKQVRSVILSTKDADGRLLQMVRDGTLAVSKLPKDLQKAGAAAASAAGQAFGKTSAFGAPPAVRVSGPDPNDVNKAKASFQKAGSDVITALARGELSAAQLAVVSARETLKRVIAAGKEQVAQAIVQAQQQATSIGADIASRAAEAIDVGPIGARITEMTAQLAAQQAAQQKVTLTRAVSEARKALNQAIVQSRTAVQVALIESGKAFRSAAGKAPAKLFVLSGPNPGLLDPGNLDLLHRKIARLGKDIATVRSFSIGTDKGETLIPQVIDGKLKSIKEAIAHFQKTGQNLGTFSSVAAANAYAERLHKQQEAFYSAGRNAGKRYSAGVTAGIAVETALVVAAAKRQVAQINKQITTITKRVAAIQTAQAARAAAETASQLNRSLADAQRQLASGQKAVADAKRDLDKAKRDLISINQAGQVQNQLGQTEGAVGGVIPLPRIDGGQAKGALGDITGGIAQARKEWGFFVDDVQKGSAQAFAPAPGQQQAIDDFLRPIEDNVTSAQDALVGMQQAVQDAAAAIVEFGKQQREQAQIDALERKKAALEAKAAAIEKRKDAAVAAAAAATEAIANRKRIADARIALNDAKIALRDFNTQAVITQLQKAVEAQKKAVTKGIADIVNQFNQGKISLPKANAQIAALLGAQGVDYRRAGAKLGSAWQAGFLAQLANLRKQMQAIIAGPFKPGAGLVQKPVSPAQAAAQARSAVAQARADLQQAQLKEQKKANSLLDQIRKEVANGTSTGKKTEQNTRPRRNTRRTQSAVNSARGSGAPSGVTGPYDPRCRTGRCP